MQSSGTSPEPRLSSRKGNRTLEVGSFQANLAKRRSRYPGDYAPQRGVGAAVDMQRVDFELLVRRGAVLSDRAAVGKLCLAVKRSSVERGKFDEIVDDFL